MVYCTRRRLRMYNLEPIADSIVAIEFYIVCVCTCTCASASLHVGGVACMYT